MPDILIEIVQTDFFKAVVLTVIAAIFGRLLTARGKLAWAVSHRHFFKLPERNGKGPLLVRTQQIWFRNLGRAALEDVEIVMTYRPEHFEIWNPRQYSENLLPDGKLSISIPNLGSKETFTITMISGIEDLPLVVNVRSKSGTAKEYLMSPQIVVSKLVTVLFYALISMGAISVFYVLLRILDLVLE